jgi:hypothetical protein
MSISMSAREMVRAAPPDQDGPSLEHVVRLLAESFEAEIDAAEAWRREAFFGRYVLHGIMQVHFSDRV